MPEYIIPPHLLYSQEHVWVEVEDKADWVLKLGITPYHPLFERPVAQGDVFKFLKTRMDYYASGKYPYKRGHFLLLDPPRIKEEHIAETPEEIAALVRARRYQPGPERRIRTDIRYLVRITLPFYENIRERNTALAENPLLLTPSAAYTAAWVVRLKVSPWSTTTFGYFYSRFRSLLTPQEYQTLLNAKCLLKDQWELRFPEKLLTEDRKFLREEQLEFKIHKNHRRFIAICPSCRSLLADLPLDTLFDIHSHKLRTGQLNTRCDHCKANWILLQENGQFVITNGNENIPPVGLGYGFFEQP